MNNEIDMTDDEKLSAYIDDELSVDATAVLTERLTQEPRLLQRLEQIRQADDAQRKLYASLAERPLPQAVTDMLVRDNPASADYIQGVDSQSANSQGADPQGAKVLAFPKRGLAAFSQRPVAIAASVALVAGFLFGTFQSADNMQGEAGLTSVRSFAGSIAAESQLHQLLETGRSGAELDGSQAGNGRVILSFQSRDGDYCRQIEVAEGSGAMQALACRRDGDWQLAVASFDASSGSAGSYVAAAGQTPALRAAVTQLMGDREPLTAAAEAELIANGWQSPKQ